MIVTATLNPQPSTLNPRPPTLNPPIPNPNSQRHTLTPQLLKEALEAVEQHDLHEVGVTMGTASKSEWKAWERLLEQGSIIRSFGQMR